MAPATHPTAAATPELLAPAGDFDAMRAAVANGANAVYFGLSDFNARHRATNFTLEELPRTIEYLHAHNVRGYVTCNTLIFSDELPEIARLVSAIAAAGADAVIVQDLGLVRLIRRLCPTLPVHGSTQMTLTEPRGIEFVRTLGVERVILARELSLPDIERITASTPTPVEVFVHGALCVSYSGQCLTSESIGGRSANRGQCAQACRLPYDLIVDGREKDLGDKAYLLSPQDLAAHDLIDDLVRLGVCSLKIEGRLKSPHYVAATTQTYRSALDSALARQPFSISRRQHLDLAQSFSRGFTHGFLSGVNHQTLVPARFPKSRGIRIGKVIAKTRTGVILERNPGTLDVPLNPGDGLVFDAGHPEQDEQGGRILKINGPGAPPVKNRSNPKRIEISFHRQDVNLAAVSIGDVVWKTDDPAVRKRLQQSFSRDSVPNRTPLSLRATAPLDGPLTVHLSDTAGRTAAATWPGPLQRTEKYPLTPGLLREQFERLGDTPFTLAEIHLDAPDPVMVPKSVLNDLRRRAVQLLLDQRPLHHELSDSAALDHIREELAAPDPITSRQSPIANLSVLIRTTAQLNAVLDWLPPADLPRPHLLYADFEDPRRYKEAVALCRAAAVPLALATLRVVKPHEHGLLQQILDCNPDAVLVRNLAAVTFFREHAPHLAQYGDYSLNIANEITASIFIEAGLKRLVPSYDLNWKQLAAMLGRIDPALFEAVIHQHMPMFHMEHCVFAATLSTGKDYRDCGRPCERHRVDLRDRVGQSHPLVADVGCRNTVFNAAAQSAAELVPRMKAAGLQHFRVELLRETPEETQTLLTRYARLLAGLKDARSTSRQLRVLNQLGVTRGTFDFD